MKDINECTLNEANAALQAAGGITMRPQLIIDNDSRQPATINILRALTAPTLLEQMPLEVLNLLVELGGVPASTPPRPTVPPLRVMA